MPSAHLKPEKVEFRGRELLTCSHGECREFRVWDYETCWEHLTTQEKENLRNRISAKLRTKESLKDLVLSGANFSGFDFSGADMASTFLDNCDLSRCKFIETNLEKAYLGWANLKEADLTRAEFKHTVFTHAKLENVTLLAYSISFGRDPLNLTMRSFGETKWLKRPHINEKTPLTAEATYRALKSLFSNQGDYDSASWASYSERVMQRKNMWRRREFGSWIASFIFGTTCGYGEKPNRSIATSVILVTIYAIIFYSLGLIQSTNPQETLTWIDTLAFSMATFCGISFPDIIPKSTTLARVLLASEAFAGIFFLGLFIFTLTKRFVAR